MELVHRKLRKNIGIREICANAKWKIDENSVEKLSNKMHHLELCIQILFEKNASNRDIFERKAALQQFRKDYQNTTNLIRQNVNSMNNLSTMANAVEEKKVNIDGFNINYAKTGKGEHAVLLLPGLLGSIWTDFKPQIENLNSEKLTIVAWEPPGYGKSRPPIRKFHENYQEQDATLARNLMKILGFDKFSVVGWSDGGVTAITLAAVYPENVRKMIVINTYAYLSPTVMENIEVLGDINSWSEQDRTSTLDVYGEKYVKDILTALVDCKRHVFEHTDGDICQKYLRKIQCPSLVVYGEKDPIFPREQADCIQANIVNSKLVTYEDAEHGPHLMFPDEFNAVANEFLID